MALRVLLADESVTIKKVIQLALQDFAVEVKAVPVGLDVLEVSKSFQPDLVFADILLQKRSGYDVCADLKKDSGTAAIPVVLMWSSFMELDQRQVDACGADGKLEKPFEVEALRKLVLELVPRTRSQRMAHFLEYPSNIAAPLKQEFSAAKEKSVEKKSDVKSSPGAMPPPAAPSMSSAGSASTSAPAMSSAAKPKMPPPLVVSSSSSSSTATKPPVKNPFASSLGAPVTSSSPMIHKMPAPEEKEDGEDLSGPSSDLTPLIPDRPEAPLGALPDLQLEGTPTQPLAKTSKADSQWSMDSFAPMELPPLSLDDDDDEDKESFQPIQLPQAEPSIQLTTEDDAADQWSNKSLDKYRMPPLKPDESLAIDDRTPDFAALYAEDPPARPSSPVTDETEVLPPPASKKIAKTDSADDDVPNFSFDENDFDKTAPLEIEAVEPFEKSRPHIIRELLKDPDFSSDDVMNIGAAGTKSAVHDSVESLVRGQVEPHLEKMIQKIVSELLPPIAERIIKRELERLLEES